MNVLEKLKHLGLRLNFIHQTHLNPSFGNFLNCFGAGKIGFPSFKLEFADDFRIPSMYSIPFESCLGAIIGISTVLSSNEALKATNFGELTLCIKTWIY